MMGPLRESVVSAGQRAVGARVPEREPTGDAREKCRLGRGLCAEVEYGAELPKGGHVVKAIAHSQRQEFLMSIKTMDDLFVATLKDIYYAEKQILKALPGMVKKANGEELKEALETHRQETEGQVERLDQVFKMLDVPARGKKCEAIEGIIDEAKEHMEEIEDEQVLDAGMISSAQAVEHYEICRYGTLIEWARDLGHRDAIGLLQQNLDQEKNADQLLSQIAKSSSNPKAVAAE
jgi:ferritin-like metal-binding protein YciE